MATASIRREWATGWPLLLSAFAGMAAPILGRYTIGQFMGPMEAELGWTRTELTMGLTLSALVSFTLSPIIGRCSDILNVRIFAIVGLILTGSMYAAFSLATTSVTLWVVLWILHAICAVLIEPVIWLSVIPTKFVASRSVAIAVVLCGNSLTVAITPALAQIFIDEYSWRVAFRLLGLLWFGSALLLTLFFFYDRRDHHARARSEAGAKARRPSILPLLKSPRFLKFALAIFAIFMAESAFLVHLAPALIDKGFTALSAAQLVGASGVTAIAGKLIAGWLFDHMPFSIVTTSVLVLLAGACALFPPFGAATFWATIICSALGLTIGAMYTVSACVTRQLFGEERFGFVFGTLTSVMVLASASGPLLGSYVHDRFGSYDLIYWAGVGIALGSAVILKTLGGGREMLAD
jgi:predicted MFS family arabinose efflux permease